MRPSRDQVKAAILHPDRIVRTAAVRYFADAYSRDPDIMPRVIEAVEAYGSRDAFTDPWCFKRLVQTDESVTWLLQQLWMAEESDADDAEAPERDDESEGVSGGDDWWDAERNWIDACEDTLAAADPAPLSAHQAEIDACETMSEETCERIATRLRLYALPLEHVWAELQAQMENCSFLSDMSDAEQAQLPFVIEALARGRDRLAARVLQELERDYDPDAGCAKFMVMRQLAGEMRLPEAIPLIIGSFDCCRTCCEEGKRSFSASEHDGVVFALEERWSEAIEETREWYAWTLACIQTESSSAACLRLLERTRDSNLRPMLLHALLQHFDAEGIEPSRQFVLESPRSLNVLALRSSLLTVCKVMDQRFPEFEAWLADSAHDANYQEQLYLEAMQAKMDRVFPPPRAPVLLPPTYEPPPVERYESIAAYVRDEPRVGRNDPCPCGSGKKFKKCCYAKELGKVETLKTRFG